MFIGWFSNKRAMRLGLCLALAFFIACYPQLTLAGNPFFPSGVVYINDGGVKSVGAADSENSKATAMTYRDGIAGQSMVSDQPGAHRIFAADGVYPAYTMWDAGSSAWTTPQAEGQDMYIILETYAGLNGWVGQSYVGGAHKVLTPADIADAAAQPADIVMEELPTPTMSAKTETSITIQFSKLLDKNNVSAGVSNDSVVGYTVYRSANGTGSPVRLGIVAQPADPETNVIYEDSTVSQGVSYYYLVSANYRWTANTPNPWYETTAKGDWSAAITTTNPPNAIRFIAGPVETTSMVKAGPITVSAYDFVLGDTGSVDEDVNILLSSNSGAAPKFYAYSSGVCDSVEIASVSIAVGQSSTSFCYSDSLAGSWTVTATPQNGWDAVTQAGEVINVGPLDYFDLSFSSPQVNDATFTGVNTATAKDAGGNTISDYAVSGVAASLSVGNGASLTNNDLAAADFTDGVADLTAKGFKYTGAAGNISFDLSSVTGKVGATSVDISPGSLTSVILRDSAGGAGAEAGDHIMTVDNSWSVFAAGYDVSDNYIAEITGAWSVTGTLEDSLESPGQAVVFSPDLSATTGTIAFDDGDGHTDSTGTITVNHGALASFSVRQDLGEQLAGVAFDLGPIVALDAKGNTVTSFSASATITDTTGTIDPAASSVFVDGELASQMVTITVANPAIVITVADSGKSGSSNAFVISHGDINHFTLSFNTPETNAAVWTGVNTITAEDEWNNVVTNYDDIGTAVELSVSNEATLDNSTLEAIDFVSGVADVTAKNFKYTGTSGNITFTATAAVSEATGTAQVEIAPGAINSVVIRNGSNNTGDVQGDHDMRVGQNLVLYAAGYDISGNYIGEISGTWGRTGTIDALGGDAASSVNYQPLVANTSGTITFDDGAGHTDSTGTISVSLGVLDHFALSLTSPQIDGVAFTGTNTVTAKDVGNNTITDFETVGSTVTLSSDMAGATITNESLTKDKFVNGIADLSGEGVVYTGPTGEVEITATSEDAKSGAASVTVNVGELHHLTFNLADTQMIGETFTGTNNLTAEDIGGNTITDFDASVDNVFITFSPAADETNKVGGLGGPEGQTLLAADDFSGGVANLTGRMTHPGPGGVYTFTATAVSGATGTSAPVTLDVGPLHHFTFENITEQRAGQSFEITIGAYSQDSEGGSHVKAAYSGSVNLSDDSGTVDVTLVGPFINGFATVRVTITNATTGNVFHVSDTEDQSIVGASNAFDVFGGTLNHFTFVSTIDNQVAGTSFETGRIEARDAWENVVVDFSEAVNITDTTATLTPTTTDVFVAGVLASGSYSVVQAMPADVISVSYLGRTGLSNGFNVVAGPVSQIIISDQSGGAGAAVGNRVLSADDSMTLYSVGYDAYNNYNSEVAGNWTSDGDIDAPTDGSHSTIEYAPDHADRSGHIMFADGDGHTATTGTISVTHGVLAGFEFIVASESARVGVALPAGSTLTARDTKGNAVTDYNASVDNVTITASTGGDILGLGLNNDAIINTAPSFVSGVADLNALGLIYAGSSGAVTLTATSASDKFGNSEEVIFGAGPVDHFVLRFNDIQHNGQPFSGENTITAEDMGDNVLTSFDASQDEVTISVAPDDGVVTGGGLASVDSFVAGVASVADLLSFTGTRGTHTFTATSSSDKTGSVSVEILPGALASLQIRNAANGAGGVVGNQTLTMGDTLAMWAAGYDSSDNFIQDVAVSWVGTGVVATHLSPVNGSQTIFSGTVPGSGVVSASIGDIYAETGTITITAGDLAKIVFLNYPYDGSYSETPPPPHANNAPITAGEPSGALIAQAQDIFGNVVTVPAIFAFTATSTGSGEFASDLVDWVPYSIFYIGEGESEATLYYQDANAGAYEITVTPEDELITGATQPLVVVPVYDQSLVFMTPERTITAGEISDVIMIELQAGGQIATAAETVTVNLSSNSTGEEHFYSDIIGDDEITSIQIPAGESSVSFYYSDNAISRSLITASADGITEASQLVNIEPSPVTHLLIIPGPTADDGQHIVQNFSSDIITVKALDQYNNPVSLTGDTYIHLSSSNETGAFSGAGTDGIWESATGSVHITIASGQSEQYFYYRDSTLGEATITASAAPEHDWIEATQIETIEAPVITKLAFITPTRAMDTNVGSEVITIQAQDSLGNAVLVSTDIGVNLITSEPVGGQFSLSPSGPWTETMATIPSGQSSVNFYYKDAIPGAKTLGVSENPSLGWADAVQQVVINPGAIDSLAFTSDQQNIEKNTVSSAIEFELQDNLGFATTNATDLTISLQSDSATGVFATNPVDGPWSVNSVTIVASTSSAVFYYRDAQPGTYTLTVAVSGHPEWTATQTIAVTEGVISQIGFVTDSQSISANTASGIISIETQNARGEALAVATDVTINLAANSGTGQFALSADGPWGISSVVIPAGEALASFYYRDSNSGTFLISADENPSNGWDSGVQQIIVGSVENTISKIKFISAPQVGDLALSGGEYSGKLTVQLQSSLGGAVTVDQITYLVVTSSHQSGRFSYTSDGELSESMVLTFQPDSSEASFYYSDTILGTAHLTVSEFPSVGWTDATQSIEVNALNVSQLSFTTSPQTTLINEASNVLTLQTRDIYGNSQDVNENTDVLLSSNSGTGSFYTTADATGTPIDIVTIPADEHTVSFYYKDATAGSYSLTATELPGQEWLAAQQAMTITAPVLSSLVIEPNYLVLPTDTNVQLSAVGYNNSGDPIPDLSIDWQVSNPAAGTISVDGVYTTRQSTGTYAQVISATTNGLTDYATVEIYEQTTTTDDSGGGSGGGSSYERTITPPTNAFVMINGGAAETLIPEVSLDCYSTNASYMMISESRAFDDGATWLPYQSTYPFTLSAGLGTKTIYVKYKSSSEDESGTVYAQINYVDHLTQPLVINTETVVLPSGEVATSSAMPVDNVQKNVANYNYVIINQNESGAPAPFLPQVLSPMSNSFVLDGQLTITGSAEPNTIVTIYIHSPELVVAKVVTDANGIFVYNLNESALSPGEHQVYAAISQAAGELVGPAVAFSIVGSDSLISSNSSGALQVVSPRQTLSFWLVLLAWCLAILLLGLTFYSKYAIGTYYFWFLFMSARARSARLAKRIDGGKQPQWVRQVRQFNSLMMRKLSKFWRRQQVRLKLLIMTVDSRRLLIIVCLVLLVISLAVALLFYFRIW